MVSFITVMARRAVRLAVRVHRDRRDRVRLADLLADRLPSAGESTRSSRRRSWRTSKSDQAQSQEKLKLHWTTLLRFKQIWPFLLGKLLTDPVWWFYLYWLPSYLAKERGQNILGSAYLLTAIYTAASVGSIAGGWLSGALIKRGWRIATRALRGDGDRRGVRAVRDPRLLHEQLHPLPRAARRRHGGAPGVVGQPVHDVDRPLPVQGGRLGRRTRRDDGRARRDVPDVCWPRCRSSGSATRARCSCGPA